MKRLFATAMLLAACAVSQQRTANSARVERGAVVLPETEIAAVLKQCSRPVPQVTGTWLPSASDVAAAERNLQKISRLRAHCCISGERIETPTAFFRQYVGLVVDGRKVLYLNAFDSSAEKWQERSVNACDGGASFWGAVFDPATSEYSELAVNGSA